MLQFLESQRVKHSLVTEQQLTQEATQLIWMMILAFYTNQKKKNFCHCLCLLLLLLSHFNRVRLCVTPQTTAHQAPLSLDSPGKNTGVGCHFLLQCMKVKSKSEIVQSCPTLSDPMDCSLPGSSIHGIFQARVLEWGAIAFSVPLFTQM